MLSVTCPIGQVNKINKNTKSHKMQKSSAVSCSFINFVVEHLS
jgi:hypothetical protein